MANTTASSISSANASPSDGVASQQSVTLPNHPLRIDSYTWQRDSHDLFDYEARTVKRCGFFISRHVRVMRSGVSVKMAQEGQPLPEGQSDYLLNVKIRDGRYLVGPADRNIPTGSNLQPKKLWMIVKDMPEEHHVLQEGDVIKLGRFKLRVKQLAKQIPGEPVPTLKLEDAEYPVSHVTEEEAKTMQCRICLLEGGTPEDPLICPCQCKGSIKFVHVDCLRHWINGRLNLTDDRRLFFKQLPCELCKHLFPSGVKLGNEEIHIVKVPPIPAPFIVLENLAGWNASRGLYVVSMFGKEELKLGRGHESDVRIPDVSISRYHATIRFDDGKFTLDDHKSKFGTLVALRKACVLDTGDKFSVQVGRTVLRLLVDEVQMPSSDVVVIEEEDSADCGDGDGAPEGDGGDNPPPQQPPATQADPEAPVGGEGGESGGRSTPVDNLLQMAGRGGGNKNFEELLAQACRNRGTDFHGGDSEAVDRVVQALQNLAFSLPSELDRVSGQRMGRAWLCEELAAAAAQARQQQAAVPSGGAVGTSAGPSRVLTRDVAEGTASSTTAVPACEGGARPAVFAHRYHHNNNDDGDAGLGAMAAADGYVVSDSRSGSAAVCAPSLIHDDVGGGEVPPDLSGGCQQRRAASVPTAASTGFVTGDGVRTDSVGVDTCHSGGADTGADGGTLGTSVEQR